jgi:hypothetical protein
MKKRFLVSLFVIVLILVGCESSPSPSSYSRPAPAQAPAKWAGIVLTGEDEPFLEGTTWVRSDNVEGWITTYEFRAAGRVIVRSKSPDLGQYTIDQTNTFSWGREGDFVKIIGSDGSWLREGKYYPQTQTIMVTMERSDGETWYETFVPLQGSYIASAPPSSTTNVYVQPSAPAQSSAQAPSAPTFQSGLYAFSGSNITMRLSGYQATAYSGTTQVAWGTYRINGNQLVITFNTGSGAGASLQGKTFAYTINSGSSFSGGSETWVRSGY